MIFEYMNIFCDLRSEHNAIFSHNYFLFSTFSYRNLHLLIIKSKVVNGQIVFHRMSKICDAMVMLLLAILKEGTPLRNIFDM